MPGFFEKKEQPLKKIEMKGLGEKDLVALFNAGRGKNLKAGDILFKKDDGDRSLYLVVSGTLRVNRTLDGRDFPLTTLSKGTWAGETLFLPGVKSSASVVAAEPSSVIAFDERGLNLLPPQIRAIVFRNVMESHCGSLIELIGKVTSGARQNKVLISQVKRSLLSTEEYRDCELVQQVLKNFPSLPVHATRITEMLVDDRIQTPEIVEFAKVDPSIVSVVLKTVNSASYGLRQKVNDFYHAVMLLGFNQIYQIVFEHCIKSVMPDTAEFRKLHQHSVIISLISFELALLCKSDKPVTLSTIGLLHDIGRSVLLLMKRETPQWGFLIDRLDHARIGSLLLRQWNLPDRVCTSVEHQYHAEFLPPEEIPLEGRTNVALLHLAHLCADYLQGKAEREIETAFLPYYMEHLNMGESSIADLSRKMVIPALKKKIDSLPQHLQIYLNRS